MTVNQASHQERQHRSRHLAAVIALAAVLLAAAWPLWMLWHPLPFLLAMPGGIALVWVPVLIRRPAAAHVGDGITVDRDGTQ